MKAAIYAEIGWQAHLWRSTPSSWYSWSEKRAGWVALAGPHARLVAAHSHDRRHAAGHLV